MEKISIAAKYSIFPSFTKFVSKIVQAANNKSIYYIFLPSPELYCNKINFTTISYHQSIAISEGKQDIKRTNKRGLYS